MKAFFAGLFALCLSFQVLGADTWRTESFGPIRAASYQMQMGDGTCSAVGITPRLLLTAKHCVDPAEAQFSKNTRDAIAAGDFELWDDGQLLGKLTVVRVSPVSDLALLSSDVDINWVPVGETPPRDAYAYVVGYPMGVAEFVTVGFVQFVKEGIIYTSAPLIFGNSGGGLFVFQDGQYVLVGIATFVAVSWRGVVPHVNGFVATDPIRSFLE